MVCVAFLLAQPVETSPSHFAFIWGIIPKVHYSIYEMPVQFKKNNLASG